jgi:hypothetical protein
MLLPILLQAVGQPGSPYDGPCAPANFCGRPVTVAAGGACLFQAWVRLDAGDRIDQDTGVDFAIYHLRLADGRVVEMFQGGGIVFVDGRRRWPGEGMPVAFQRDGEQVYRLEQAGVFKGYWVRDLQVTGPNLTGDAADGRFFNRFAFGAAAARRCGGKS